jgi:serine protease Do
VIRRVDSVGHSRDYCSSRRSGGRALAVIIVSIGLILPSLADAAARQFPESFADLTERLLPAVVNISSSQTVKGRSEQEMPKLPPGSPFEDFFKEFFDRERPQERGRQRASSLGSGFIIDKRGYVVTNNHVIQDADEITVILQDNSRLIAKLVGKDPKTDIAVLKVESEKDLPVVLFGNSDKARVGDWVIAIGNPFALGGSVTAGIISARNRNINSGPYDTFIQTDASINRGNSGGPLFNLQGQVIGINTAIFSPSGGSVGIGFSVPSSMAKPVIDQLIKHGKMRRGWLGVHIQAVTDEIAESLGLKEAAGALVASVIPDGPAEAAKIEAGDVVLEFDGKEVASMRRLPLIVAETEIDKSVKVVVWRDKKRLTLSVKVGALEEGETKMTSKADGPSDTGEMPVDDLGLTLSDMTPTARDRFKLDKTAKGVVVTAVDSAGVAAAEGIRPGDLILEVSQEEVKSVSDVVDKVGVAKKAGRKQVLVLVEGQSGTRFVVLRIKSS